MSEKSEVDILQYWDHCLKQNADAMREYFHDDAEIKWHNTNERFNVDEFIIANCEYPGKWNGKVERIEVLGNLYITVTHVYAEDHTASLHVTSFIKMDEGKIQSIDEYWGDDGSPPKWRQEKHLGRELNSNKSLDIKGAREHGKAALIEQDR